MTLGYRLGDVDFTYTLALPRTQWKAGWQYTYALRFSLSEITASPTVSLWDSEGLDQHLP